MDFRQRLWDLTERQDKIAVADIEKDKVVNMVANTKVDEVADKLTDMVADEKEEEQKGMQKKRRKKEHAIREASKTNFR